MLTLADVAAQHTDLSAADVDFLKLLVEQWDLVADLSFGDLILWLPDADPHVFWAAAQVRPTTGPTALHDDVVGESLSYETDSLVTEAFLTGEESTTSGNKLHAGIPVDCRAVPILRQGRVVGVVEVHTNQMGVRAPGALEENYLQCAAALRAMIQHGEFPMAGEKPVPSISPRVVDGLVRVDASGNVVFASPNATSAFRRLGVTGDVVGETFKSLLASVPPESRGPIERAITLSRDSVREFDLETKKASLRLRVQPLVAAGSLSGYLLTCRDTTELRTQERQLVSKDATIREIHHRVKNNLQTVSALLRLQARRTGSIEAKDALNDAQKRVGAIAVVHEILSQAYDDTVRFDDVRIGSWFWCAKSRPGRTSPCGVRDRLAQCPRPPRPVCRSC